MNQFGAGGNVWKSNKHYTLRETTRRKVLKFNTTGIDYHVTLNPQSNGVPLMDQLGEIFDSMVNEMTIGMADNDLVNNNNNNKLYYQNKKKKVHFTI